MVSLCQAEPQTAEWFMDASQHHKHTGHYQQGWHTHKIWWSCIHMNRIGEGEVHRNTHAQLPLQLSWCGLALSLSWWNRTHLGVCLFHKALWLNYCSQLYDPAWNGLLIHWCISGVVHCTIWLEKICEAQKFLICPLMWISNKICCSGYLPQGLRKSSDSTSTVTWLLQWKWFWYIKTTRLEIYFWHILHKVHFKVLRGFIFSHMKT